MNIFFIDLEVTKHTKKVDRAGYLYSPKNIQENSTSLSVLKSVLNETQPKYICGHNFLDHDQKFLEHTGIFYLLKGTKIIDSFLVSMLLFPDKSSHKLTKPYKIDVHIENNPLEDCKATQALLFHCIEQFNSLKEEIQKALHALLHDEIEFSGFFDYLDISDSHLDIANLFVPLINADKQSVNELLNKNPIEMAILLVYLHTRQQSAISKSILYRFPNIAEILKSLQQKSYSNNDLVSFAQEEFDIEGFDFRSFDQRDKGNDLFSTGQLSQKEIVLAALEDKSLLATLPTGGGKTITFQLPALIKAKAYKGLTIVISPLQALMKNHVESFRDKNQNYKIAAISGYLSPIERINALEEVQNGIIDILYLAPEALRSNSIFQVLTHRYIERFVIDEAHCFSSWGHDFRHDYKYIPTFIQDLQDHSKFQSNIPVSCFTATAKPEVLDEIKSYFESNLSLEIDEFYASAERSNLSYRGIAVKDQKHKYELLLNELVQNGEKPTIIYIPQNARLCKELSETLKAEPSLQELGLEIEPFYAKIDSEIESGERIGRNKSEILDDFINDKINIVIATTAFGMGIDKPNIQTVIHYETSDSLESYLQESGRGGRSDSIEAECIVLFCEQDFDKIFQQQNRSKVEPSEIQRILKVIKRIKRNPAILSLKQIAESAGIDTEDSQIDYDVMIKTALLELEQHEIIKRGRNSTKIYATSISNATDENQMERIHKKLAIYDNEKEAALYDQMIRVMNTLIGRSKVDPIEIDTLSDNVGVNRQDIHKVLLELSKQELIAMDNDISASIKASVVNELNKHFELETNLLTYLAELPDYQAEIDLRSLIFDETTSENQVRHIKKTLQSFSHLAKLAKQSFKISFRKESAFLKKKDSLEKIEKRIKIRQKLAKTIITRLLDIEKNDNNEIEFSSYQLKKDLEEISKVTLEGFHHTLVYLHENLKEFKLKNGRLIYFQGLSLEKTERIEESTPYQVRRDYNPSLRNYYQHKTESIHILLKFFNDLVDKGWDNCKHYINDYFALDYAEFKKRYEFDNKLIQLPVTPNRHKMILESLNPEQSEVFSDATSTAILVLAGPGSGKTKTLVHKIASLITLEGHKPEYFLMLTHGRSAANEFRDRLVRLVGNLGYEVDIMTFHAYALQLLGRRISEQMPLNQAIDIATKRLLEKQLSLPAKSMLVLDEYQDVSAKTFMFIQSLWENMSSDKQIIAVGDDDQCINNFSGNDRADIRFMHEFSNNFSGEKEESDKQPFKQYSLLTNYRSKSNLVRFSNEYTSTLPGRLKNDSLLAKQKQTGYIRISKHETHERMLAAVAEKIMKDPGEEIAALCRTNHDVLTLYSILKANGVAVKYLTSKDGFRLGDIHELRYFLKTWQQTGFKKAQDELTKQFSNSDNYYIAKSVIERFVNYESYESEKIDHQSTHFEQYLKDVEFDEFEYTKSKVIVSTMHKAKGKEFDSVYILAEKGFISDDYQRRLLYVAITRAKNNLYIHSEGSVLTNLESYADEVVIDEETHFNKYPIILTMGLNDLFLSYKQAQHGINKTQPRSGDTVQIQQQVTNNGDLAFTLHKDSIQIGKLSKPDSAKTRLSAKILDYQAKGYSLEPNSKIEYIVSWNKPDNETQSDYLQALCQISMYFYK